MIKILFICHGNICRSVMAEYIAKNMFKNGAIIASRATSYEEIGNDIYPPIKRVLNANNIPFAHHEATHLKKNDCDYFDLLLCMDDYNVINTKKIAGINNYNKIHKLKEYINSNEDISDPWYTRDFNKCYKEINECIINLYNSLNII